MGDFFLSFRDSGVLVLCSRLIGLQMLRGEYATDHNILKTQK